MGDDCPQLGGELSTQATRGKKGERRVSSFRVRARSSACVPQDHVHLHPFDPPSLHVCVCVCV